MKLAHVQRAEVRVIGIAPVCKEIKDMANESLGSAFRAQKIANEHICPECHGSGKTLPAIPVGDFPPDSDIEKCLYCRGWGRVTYAMAKSYRVDDANEAIYRETKPEE